jgi:hypothetical protein
LLCWVGVHCGIYRGFYNRSYLNSPPPTFSFIPSSLHLRNSFNRYLFSVYIHVYIVFALYCTLLHTFPTSSPLHWYQAPPAQAGPVPPSCSLISASLFLIWGELKTDFSFSWLSKGKARNLSVFVLMIRYFNFKYPLPIYVIITFCFVFWFFLCDRVLLCSQSWPWTCNLPVSASQVLELQVCANMPGCVIVLTNINTFIPLKIEIS